MFKIRLRKKTTKFSQKYDIILTRNLSRQTHGNALILGTYIPCTTCIKLNKIQLTQALNAGAQMSNSVRHLLNQYLSYTFFLK